MKIFLPNGSIAVEQVSDESYRSRSIRGENNLTVCFSAPGAIDIPIGSWCEYPESSGNIYTLMQPGNLKKNGTRHFDYTLVMESEQAHLKKYRFREIFQSTATNRFGGSPRLKFSYTAKPEQHLQMLVDNLNEREESPEAGKWKVGKCIVAGEQSLSFNHTSCWDALNQMADAFNTEWEIRGKSISLCKVEYNRENPLPLSYGRGNGFKPGVGRMNLENTLPVEVLYVQGGSKNIDPSTYPADSDVKSSELLLPRNVQYRYEGRTYITDEYGYSVKKEILETKTEDSLDLSYIYPKGSGTVTEVFTEETPAEDDPEHLDYFFTDTEIPEELDYNEYVIEGEKITVIFQEGMLAGKEFDAEYDHKEKRFHIYPQTIDGQTMPNEQYAPETGQEYAVFGISLPENYICDNTKLSGASWDMLREAVRYLYEHEKPTYSFTGELDGIWAKKKWDDIKQKIIPGGYISFTDAQFQEEPVSIRIVGIKDYINDPYSPVIELSNAPAGGSVAGQLNKIEENEVAAEELYKNAIRYGNRRFRDVTETTEALKKAQLNFSEAVNPVSVHTMQTVVGDESLQFRFVTDKTDPKPTDPGFGYNNTAKTLFASPGILQHMTLGISAISTSEGRRQGSAYRFWDMEKLDIDLRQGAYKKEKGYYLYAKCSVETPAEGKKMGYLLSESSMKMTGRDPLDNKEYYYFLTGYLNSETEGSRSFVGLYGYTEILPGQITTDLIRSTNGKTYFNLSDNEIGGTIKFISSSGSYKNIAGVDDLANALNDTNPNLIRNGNFAAGETEWSKSAAAGLSVTSPPFLKFSKAAFFPGTKASNIFYQQKLSPQSLNALNYAPNKDVWVTLSFWVYTQTGYAPGVQLSIGYADAPGGNPAKTDWRSVMPDKIAANEWVKVANSINLRSDANPDIGIRNCISVLNVQVGRGAYSGTTGWQGYISNVKVETGKVATPYNDFEDRMLSLGFRGSTEIAGGVVSTNVLLLNNEGKENRAGISGILSGEDTVFLWGGANGYDNRSNANVRMLMDGSIYSRSKYIIENKEKKSIAGITGEGDEKKSVFIFAGIDYSERSIAPFRVQKNGCTIFRDKETGKEICIDPEESAISFTNDNREYGTFKWTVDRENRVNSLLNQKYYESESSTTPLTETEVSGAGYVLKVGASRVLVIQAGSMHNTFGIIGRLPSTAFSENEWYVDTNGYVKIKQF